LPGWVITRPYLPKEQTFISEKETAGGAQKSEVLDVGADYIDDHGNPRTTEVKKGDVILHFYSQHDFEIEFSKYRAIHFSQIIGVLKNE
jgi:co-chaperonin GroES (HSP10)